MKVRTILHVVFPTFRLFLEAPERRACMVVAHSHRCSVPRDAPPLTESMYTTGWWCGCCCDLQHKLTNTGDSTVSRFSSVRSARRHCSSQLPGNDIKRTSEGKESLCQRPFRGANLKMNATCRNGKEAVFCLCTRIVPGVPRKMLGEPGLYEG